MSSLLTRDSFKVSSCLFVITLMSWVYMILMALSMRAMESHSPLLWGLPQLTMLFSMWVIMMIGMMIPSASPYILMYDQVNRRRKERKVPYVSTFLFVAGYLAIWTIYSLIITLVQWQLHEYAILNSSMKSSVTMFNSIILAVAGLYQFSNLKYTCLKKCRSPLHFLTHEWKEGNLGGFRMGLMHGNYCLGCCWALMSLLFVTGVMDLTWIALISFYVLAEKVFPKGILIGKLTGILLILSSVIAFYF
ncbi:hypothetical protein A9Q84_00500 [Halobacteriovorax marinus]|uniref:Metal-binding integral membrane protein n=1 Tax=Halobacteriovorax marinus TaxID=97084 RepID=A0A1Y5FBF0_9BACT|nr:hypothetical protein A9Q84_00500 [Halobacteriovorax marinus]